ncbi:potassium channel family protein [Sandarakinorhabdus sp. DWP1-3-1]|uniref:potassium channel family protein n=1 Tax=Sandarakinorhabdus sp. DWP1-3-1 TaxID=2804627 RepID=UPI003CF6101B
MADDDDRHIPLHRRSRLSTTASLALRALLVAGLFGIAVAGHWYDRDGLRDNTDGSVSFLDVIYFTAVTVTTVGYGDIVPVTPSARMFDTFVVTPIRLFVWLIFLGSAYSFVIKDSWSRVRTRMIGDKLHDHFIVCGYGASGAAAVEELCREGISADAIVVVDSDPAAIAAAVATGTTGVTGDATHNATLEAAFIHRARGVLIATGRDDTAALVTLTARQLNHAVPISVSVRAHENEDLLRQAGANAIINPVRLGGHLLARSSSHRHAVDYIADLAGAAGCVALCERPALPAEVGKPLRSVSTGLAVRIIRDGKIVGFWEPGANTIAAGDTIVEILPV